MLEKTAELLTPATTVWTPVGIAPTVSGGVNTVTISGAGVGLKFYRLNNLLTLAGVSEGRLSLNQAQGPGSLPAPFSCRREIEVVSQSTSVRESPTPTFIYYLLPSFMRPPNIVTISELSKEYRQGEIDGLSPLTTSRPHSEESSR